VRTHGVLCLGHEARVAGRATGYRAHGLAARTGRDRELDRGLTLRTLRLDLDEHSPPRSRGLVALKRPSVPVVGGVGIPVFLPGASVRSWLNPSLVSVVSGYPSRPRRLCLVMP